MFRTLIILLAAPAVAHAGCAKYAGGSLSDPAPVVEICLDGACERTTQDFVCGGVSSASRGYANGWSVGFDAEKRWATKRDAAGNKTIDLPSSAVGVRLTCVALSDPDDADACF